MTLPPSDGAYEIDCHAVASELREAMTKTEAVSDDLPKYTRMDATGANSFQESPAGTVVYWADYKRLLDALVPYRDELLKIAADVGEPGDPFAAWEAIDALSRRAANSAGGVEVVELLAKHPSQGLPKAYGGCTCSCHRMPGVMHIAACCRPSDGDREPLMTREWFERKVVLEGDGDVSAGPLSALAPAVEAEPVGEAGSMPGTEGFTMAAFKASEVPIGTKLYTHLSSSVSAEVTVTDEMVERAAMVIAPHLWKELTHEQRMSDDYAFSNRRDAQDRARKQARAALESALNGGRDNG